MDSSSYIERLDELSWGCRIDKLQERGSDTEWHVQYVNPKDTVWYSSQDRDLAVALKRAVDKLEQDGVKGIYSTNGTK